MLTCITSVVLGQPNSRTNKTFLHLDQGAEPLGFHTYQSGVYIEESSISDHCFRVLKGSHKSIQQFYDNFPLAAIESNYMEYYELRDVEIKWYNDYGCSQTTFPVSSGGMEPNLFMIRRERLRADLIPIGGATWFVCAWRLQNGLNNLISKRNEQPTIIFISQPNGQVGMPLPS